MIMEIDLKKRKLEEEIYQLERELHKKEKKGAKEDLSTKKERMKMSISPR
jgi:hypothetical protein